ncbi:TonB-dependent receptor [Croceicoccus sp. BE223]|uniref:TonB-dependent receptor n=1 Tax=Croceicoccus sp. BE223 TaxID=2817716 RepID=UPI002864AAA2|nr:TonB-dependent receptor [Croceicoccus sp. BE223]MDR7102692.1 iron complex outermembrane receptor protein [Croceicoccus sp. BE223]
MKTALFACAASPLAMAALMLATPAAAQDDAGAAALTADAGDAGGEIIVTARRREERLVDVPIAVTTLSGDQLEQRGALDLTDIAQSTPNTTLESSRGTNSTLSAFIRGVGQQDPVSGFEQGVGIYLDDVYLNRPQGAVLDIYDVERVEVLRGPQGTLYGRNTIGGAVKYVTKSLPDEVSVKAKATYGSYNQLDGVLTASAPISDMLRVGASVARLTRDGFGENITTGKDNYDKDVFGARGTIELGGRDSGFTVRLSGDYTHDMSNPRGGHRLIQGTPPGGNILPDVYDTAGAIDDPHQDVEAWGLAGHISVDLTDALTFKSITAWRVDHSATPIDFDASPVVDLDVPAFYDNEQVSQEFQLAWDDGGALQGLLGFYWLDAIADTYFDSRLYTFLPGFMLTGHTNAQVDTKTYAIFADMTYDFTERLSLSLGGRYTWDKRDADIYKANYILGGSGGFDDPVGTLFSVDTDFTGSAKFKKFTPRASLSFKPTPDHNLYASYSKGFKGGGFDPRGAGSRANDLDGNGSLSDEEIATYLSFDPEVVDSYEVGYKGSLLDGALYLATALFRMDYSDIQIPGSVPCTGAGGVQTFCGVVSNAGKARLQGAELEMNARLGRDLVSAGDRLSLSGAVGYIDAEFKKYETLIGGQPVDVAQYRYIQNTPEWTASGTLAYSTPVGAGDLAMSTTWSYRSLTHQFEYPNPYIDQPGYGLWDASLVYSAPENRWSIGLHGKNILDKQYITSGYSYIAQDAVTGQPVLNPQGNPIPTLGQEGTLTAFYGNPRQVFVTAQVRF